MSHRRTALIEPLRHYLGNDAPLWSALLPPVVFVAAALQLGRSGVDPDYWWHLASGRWMLDHGRIPATDPFSATHGGQNWYAHEWLAELLIGLIDKVAGYAGEIVVTALIVAAGGWLLGRAGRYYGSGALGALLIVVAANFYLLGNLAVRPQVWGWALFTLLLHELAAYETGRRRGLWQVPLIFALWINVHLSALLGGGTLALYVLHRLVRWFAARRPGGSACAWRPLRHVFLVAVLSALALLMNPRGPALIWFTRVYANPNAERYRYIGEWQRPSFSGNDRYLIVAAAAVVLLLVAATIWRRSLWPGVLVPLFAAASLRAVRYVSILAIVAIPALGWLTGGLIRNRAGLVARPVPRALAAALAITAVVAVWFGAYALSPSQFRRVPNAREGGYPVDAAAWVKQHVPTGTIFNEYGWGGYLIYTFYPERRVYMDGREEMYGETFFTGFVDTISAAPGWQATLTRADVRATVISPTGPLAAAMDADPGWRRMFADAIAAVYVPTGKEAP